MSRKQKFLLDENVRAELEVFLRKIGAAFIIDHRGASDKVLAQLSKKQRLVLVTNDSDFADAARDEIFGVVLLRLPQKDARLLTENFGKLLGECKQFEGKLTMLSPVGWESFNLFTERN